VTSEDRDTVPADNDGEKGTESRSLPIPAAGTEVAGSSVATPAKKHLPVWQESILLIAVALGLAIILKAFFIQAFYIPSESMEPGLIQNDRILVQKMSYWGSGTPQRGDVVVFEDPDNWLAGESAGPTNMLAKGLAKVGLYPTGGHLVKRVIGVGGDTVTCCDAKGRLSINGFPMDEKKYFIKDAPCAAPGSIQNPQGPCSKDGLKITIPKGYLLVMGDNRANSADSTAHLCERNATDCPPTRGLVPVDLVVGKVFALVWPLDRFDHVTRPDVFKDVPDPR
jgi:signal peptidase I